MYERLFSLGGDVKNMLRTKPTCPEEARRLMVVSSIQPRLVSSLWFTSRNWTMARLAASARKQKQSRIQCTHTLANVKWKLIVPRCRVAQLEQSVEVACFSSGFTRQLLNLALSFNGVQSELWAMDSIYVSQRVNQWSDWFNLRLQKISLIWLRSWLEFSPAGPRYWRFLCNHCISKFWAVTIATAKVWLKKFQQMRSWWEPPHLTNSFSRTTRLMLQLLLYTSR